MGRLFKRINLPVMIDPQYPVRGGIANSDFPLVVAVQPPTARPPSQTEVQAQAGC